MFEKYVYTIESYIFPLTFFVTKKYNLPVTDFQIKDHALTILWYEQHNLNFQYY